MTNPNTASIRDQIGALLRESDKPLSTYDVAASAPAIHVTTSCDRRLHHHPSGLVDTRHMSERCHGDHHHVLRRMTNGEVYRYLKQMETAGEIERLKFATMRVVFWKWVKPVEISVEELERMFAGRQP